MTAYSDMKRLSAKLLQNVKTDVTYWCPGCKGSHTITVNPVKGYRGPVWQFDGNFEKPTFSPSVRHFTPAGPYGENGEHVAERTNCHYHIRSGMIEYCNDCQHELNGQTVPLPDFPIEHL